MKTTVYGVRWLRVLVAGIATHLLNVMLVVALVIVASLLAVGTGSGIQSEVPIDRLAERVATWGVPVLTVLAAARGNRPPPCSTVRWSGFSSRSSSA